MSAPNDVRRDNAVVCSGVLVNASLRKRRLRERGRKEACLHIRNGYRAPETAIIALDSLSSSTTISSSYSQSKDQTLSVSRTLLP